MVKLSVTSGKLRGKLTVAHGKTRPYFRTDRTSHSLGVVVVAELSGIRRIYSAVEIFAHDGVFSRRVGTVVYKAVKKVV